MENLPIRSVCEKMNISRVRVQQWMNVGIFIPSGGTPGRGKTALIDVTDAFVLKVLATLIDFGIPRGTAFHMAGYAVSEFNRELSFFEAAGAKSIDDAFLVASQVSEKWRATGDATEFYGIDDDGEDGLWSDNDQCFTADLFFKSQIAEKISEEGRDISLVVPLTPIIPLVAKIFEDAQ